MKPNLFIVGAPKCGTTAWYRYLAEHADIFFPPDVKEPHYFAHDLPGFRKTRDLVDYLSLFDEAGDKSVLGDASVFYLYSQIAASAIHAFNPESKILIFVRRQSDFMLSFHEQLLFTFDESIVDLPTAWELSGRRPKESIPSTCHEERVIDYKAVGRFPEQISRYRELFPAENIRIYRFEDWTSDPRSTYVDILRFLGVPDDGRTDFPRINEARFHKSPALGKFLFRPPRSVEFGKGVLKKALGVETLGIADAISKMNRKRGYRSDRAGDISAEIERYYVEENQDLSRIWPE
jgi:hypothetical protein